MTPSVLDAEIKAHTVALRLRLLRERSRASAAGWTVPKRVELLRSPSAFEIPLMLCRFLTHGVATTLIDVGANNGSWAQRVRRFIPVTYIGVEPDPRAFGALRTRFAGDEALHNAAAGSEPGMLTLNLAADSVYSSAGSYLADSPIQTNVVERVQVPVITLDSLAVATSQIVVKIDVQGLEADVLYGASRVLDRATVVVLEAPLWPTTNNDTDLGLLTALLRDHGLSPHYFGLPGLRVNEITIPVEYDVIFGRPQRRPLA